MNFDRNYKTDSDTDKNSLELIGKIQKLPVVKKVYLYILLMTAIGAGMGGIKYRLEAKNCMANDLVLMQSLMGETPKTALHRCWTVQPTQRRVRELGVGAIAGMITATLISIPALLEEN